MLTANRKRVLLWTAGTVSLLGIAFAISVYRGTERAALDAAREVESRGKVRFASVALERRGAPEGFEWVGGSAGGFIDAALFQDHLFLLTPSELLEYDANGAQIARFRAGFELPSSALISLHGTGATSFESKQPELFVTTATAGYLAYDGSSSWRHVRIEGQRLLGGVHVLGNGRVLIGTERAGLLAHDSRGLAPFHDSLRQRKVTFVAGSDEASLWIGTLDQGLFEYRGGRLQPVAPVPDQRVLWIEVDGPRRKI